MKERFDSLKEELQWVALAAALIFALMQVAFYKGSILENLRSALSLLWLFVLPGYAITLRWKEHISLFERLAAGSLLAAGMMGIASYYSGLMGLHVQFHAMVLPPMIMIAGIWSWIKWPLKDSQG